MFIVRLYSYQNSATFPFVEFGYWGHLFNTLWWYNLWSKDILCKKLVVGTYFEQKFVLITNMLIIYFKIHSESVYLLKYIPKVSLDLQTDKNFFS